MRKDYTPTPVVHQGLQAVRDLCNIEARTVLDLSAGSGSFGTVFPHVFPGAKTHGIEAREEEAWWLSKNYDTFELKRFKSKKKYDVIATNPPFDQWREIVPEAIRCLTEDNGILVLLGLTSWGSRSKAGVELFAEHTPILQLRIAGTVGYHGRGKGADQRDYCWWVWSKYEGHISKNDLWVTMTLPRMESEDRNWVVPPGRESGYGKETQLCRESYFLEGRGSGALGSDPKSKAYKKDQRMLRERTLSRVRKSEL